MKNEYVIITNNPLILKKIEKDDVVIYKDVSYENLLKDVRDRIHRGYRLLSHPLSGSVKPGETPYKSVMISAGEEGVDAESLKIIESSIDACKKFKSKTDKYSLEIYEDFQLIDWTLIESAISSVAG